LNLLNSINIVLVYLLELFNNTTYIYI